MKLLLKDKTLSHIVNDVPPVIDGVTMPDFDGPDGAVMRSWPCDTMLEPGTFIISSIYEWDGLGLPESARDWVWAALQIKNEIELEVE